MESAINHSPVKQRPHSGLNLNHYGALNNGIVSLLIKKFKTLLKRNEFAMIKNNLNQSICDGNSIKTVFQFKQIE